MKISAEQFAMKVLALLCLLILPATAFSSSLPRALQLIANGHTLPPSSYSLLVQEIRKDVPELSIRPDTSRNPASVIKTLTTLVALDELGPAYLWPTEVYALGPVKAGVLHGDLLLKGYGDPYLVTENFWKMLQALRRQGLHHITGDLLIDDSYFQVAATDPGEFDNKPDRSYNVLPNAMLVNFKAAYFHFYADRNGRTVSVQTDPVLPNLTMTNNLRLSKSRCGGYQRGIAINIAAGPQLDRVSFDGRFPASCGHYVMSRTVLTPQTFAFGVFQSLWQQLGGKLTGTVKAGIAPPDKKPYLTWQSRPLGEVIRLVNKYSNNVMTRQLLLTVAAETKGEPGTVENGRLFVNEFLQTNGMDPQSLSLINGAGLSRDTRISARLLADILLYADSIPYMPEFISSLSIMGMDGTARNRLKRHIRAGHAHIKTGTIDDVSAIAGYVNARSGKRFVVVGILNNPKAHRGPGEELMNALIEWTYKQ